MIPITVHHQYAIATVQCKGSINVSAVIDILSHPSVTAA